MHDVRTKMVVGMFCELNLSPRSVKQPIHDKWCMVCSLISPSSSKRNMFIRVVPKKNSSSQGANERLLPTDFRSAFIFFLTLRVDFSFSIKVFKNPRGDPWMTKNLKKNRFLCLISQKNHLEKCSLKVKPVFENTDFVEVID